MDEAHVNPSGGTGSQSGSVLLVSCYELGHQPLGISVPAAFLNAAGFATMSVDLSRCALERDVVERARLVAISVPMHTALKIGVRAANQIRSLNPGAHICFFGLYAHLNAEHLLDGLADSVLAGEIEDSLARLAQALFTTRSNPIDEIPGIGLKTKQPIPILKKLSFLPPHRSNLLPLDQYAHYVDADGKRMAGAIETTRGCLYHCRHCPIPPIYAGRLFAVPVDTIMADVDLVVEDGARHITFSDPDFLNAPSHAHRVVRRIHLAHPELTFDFTAKIEHILTHQHLIPEFFAFGCRFIVSAVEALSNRVLTILDKGHNRDDVFRAVDLLDAAGIALRPSLLPFTPWSTLQDFEELLDWITERGLIDHVDPVQLSIRLLVPPGSLLEKHPQMTPHLLSLDPEDFTWRWRHPDPRMDALQEKAARIVEQTANDKKDSSTVQRILREALLEIQGKIEVRHETRLTKVQERRRSVIPRLTEPWFC